MKVSQKDYVCTIFETAWGYFGLAGTDKGVCRTVLPQKEADSVRKLVCRDLKGARFEPKAWNSLQKMVKAYFNGSYADFSEATFDLDELTSFTRTVLKETARIPAGKVLNYSQLALKIGKPSACRAVASALARNPIPLLIPCHRIIRTDGSMGGFSAPGGIPVKIRLLDHEKASFQVEAAYQNVFMSL